ncbi:unnamed protein product [Chilo suppressalis]|uniref:tRNA-splicing endonuclease subunit Sen54 N-terminal domain-containing protein n=1 Tax=Chilo suppressalis TaxID=168631 RepID=A0ABN8ATH6_CHISP|nr:hypothetical protein evm_003748 [Chilo suppressalis]CAH0397777.1 unnamed protein product [Chilo suppressalis]
MGDINFLSGEELLDKGITKLEITLPALGLKDVSPNGSWLEQKQIQSALEARKHHIEAQRIEKRGVLSHAVWREDLKLAEVTHQVGSHWKYLGHSKDKKMHLKPEEALYLMEVNCLLLTFNDIVVSLQQAYSLLFCDAKSIGKYRVYSYLSRLGYKVLHHNTSDSKKEYKEDENKTEEKSKIDVNSDKNTVQNEMDNIDDTNKDRKNNELKKPSSVISNEEINKKPETQGEVFCNNELKQQSDCTNVNNDEINTYKINSNHYTNSISEIKHKDKSQELVTKVNQGDVQAENFDSATQVQDNLTNRTDNDNYNIYNQRNDPLTKFMEWKLNKLKDRQLKTKAFNNVHKHFVIIPDLSQNRVVTVNVPKEELLPKNIFLNHLTYVLNLDSISSKNVVSSSVETGTYSISDDVNGDHIRRVTNALNRSQNVVVPPIYQNFRPNINYRQFQYWRPRPNLNYFQFNLFFQRPFMTNFNTPRFQFYPRTHIPMFPRYFTSPIHNTNSNADVQNRDQSTRKRKRDNARIHHLESIKNLAIRLRSLISSGNTQKENVDALQRLIHNYNIRYRTKVRLTDQFDIVNDETIIETIELDDDDEDTKSKRRRVDDNDSLRELHLDKIRQISFRLKQLEMAKKASPRHRRALSGLIKTYNKSYNADIYLENNEVLDRQSITLDSSSEHDCVIEESPQIKIGKKLRNPFNILKRLSEKQVSNIFPTTSKDSNEHRVQTSKNTVLDVALHKSWIPDQEDFGRPEVLSRDNMNIRIIESKKEEYLYEFLNDNRTKFNNWIETKIAFLESIEESNVIFQTEVMKEDNVDIKSIIQAEDCTDMPSVLRKLNIIKKNDTTCSESNLTIDFDVYNRNIQDFRKTEKPTPHFRIVCLNDTSPLPSGIDIATLHSKFKDGVMIVFAVVGPSSISFLQMNPIDSLVYTASNN